MGGSHWMSASQLHDSPTFPPIPCPSQINVFIRIWLPTNPHLAHSVYLVLACICLDEAPRLSPFSVGSPGDVNRLHVHP